MSRLPVTGRISVWRKFLRDSSGIATAEWVAVTSAFVIAGIAATYIVLGNDEEGMIALVNNKKEQLVERVDDVDNMISQVESWTPEGQ